MTYNFGKVHTLFKEFGPVERIKVRLTGKNVISAFVTFFDNESANKAFTAMSNREDMSCSTFRLLSSKNVVEEDSDYIPKLFGDKVQAKQVVREQLPPTWFVASYKDKQDNSLKGLQCLERYVGVIPKDNFKKYGRSLLIQAKDNLQAIMLQNITLSQDDIILSVKPHSTFNLTRGVIYSHELHDFSEEEILDLCPQKVYNVMKLRGRNNAIVLSFSSHYLPDYLNIKHLTFKVRKYRLRPQQCYNCYDYGHVSSYCKNQQRCNKCSVLLLDDEHDCSSFYCLHCKGNHSPQSHLCARFQFESAIVDITQNEHVSYGRARSKLMGANKSPESTYAKVISQIKVNEAKNSTPQVVPNVASVTQPITIRADVHSSLPNLGRSPASSLPDIGQLETSADKPQSSVRPRERTLKTITPKTKNTNMDHNKGNTSKGFTKKHSPSQEPSGKTTSKPTTTGKSRPSVDQEGFWSPEGHKRARPISPKSEKGISTKNSFGALELESPAKKKVGLDEDLASLSRNLEVLPKPYPTTAGASASSQSPNEEMEADAIIPSGSQDKPRNPPLDRKLSRNNIKPQTSFSQSKGKTGNSKSSK